ncbi:matrixin family metalloprotease [Pseudonocardia acidicola]|uniref:Matrixin family metalloprotease n=1 Tax=Pseudonocardia acidicola TaxID=2724939 RepID=A0ABX1S4N2_9PSEU|nr:matrixin family metalloprotease [Pseudonocardia acidicola]NMH96533.1 matrixin family metalloprotease [Pseudonocardia acidicola]
MSDEFDRADSAAMMAPEPRHVAPQKAAALGDEGDQVEQIYEYLRRFGYFPNQSLARRYPQWRPAMAFELADPRVYDEQLKTAVSLFQKANGLAVTGEVDDATVGLMKRPRCGFPDIVTADGPAEFTAQGNRWNSLNVTYSHTNTTPDLSAADVRGAVRGALDRWAAVTPLNFTENPSGGDMRIGFFSGDHGDGAANAFDGAGGVLAHCFYPPPNGGDIAGDCHFDEAETWSVNLPPTGTDLPTVALHEFGHGLGLAHSSVTSSVMYAFYGGPRRELTDDDIAGIRSVYGTRFRWASLSGIILDPVTASNADGRLEVFARGTDGALWHIWQTAPNNGWSGWHSLGGVIQGAPSVGRNADGRLEVFARGTDGALWHIWQTAPNGGWSGWASLGGWIVNPLASSNADGRLEVFAQGADGALWHIWQTAPNNGWSGWASLGGRLTTPVTTRRNRDGRLEVFVRGTDGALWHIWQTAPNSGWSGWASLGGRIIGTPVVGGNADGRLEVFVRGTDNALWHIWQTAPGNGWSGWASLGGIIDMPAVPNNADGRMEVFVRGADNGLWHIWQTAPNGGWSGWASLGGRFTGGPVASRNADGRLEVFVRGTDNALWHTWQSAANNGWS